MCLLSSSRWQRCVLPFLCERSPDTFYSNGVVFEQGATDESPAHDNHNLRDQLEIHDHQTQHSQHDNSFVRGIGDDSCIWMPNRTQCSDYMFSTLSHNGQKILTDVAVHEGLVGGVNLHWQELMILRPVKPASP